MSTETTNPDSGNAYEGVADIDAAADILASQMEAEEEQAKPEEDEPQAATADAEDAEPDETDDEEESDAVPDEPEDSEDSEEAEEPEDEDQTFSVTVQGEEKEVTLDELRSGYMMQSDYTRKSQSLAQERNEFYGQRQQQAQVIEQQLQEVGFLANELLNQVVGQEQNLEELRQLDPAEYAAKHAEMAHKKEMLNRAFNAYQQSQQANNQFGGELQQQYLTQQQDLLLSALPEWTNPDKAQAEKQQIASYLLENGFEQNEVGNLADYRAVVMARKAMLYDQMQGKRKEASKKVSKPVPKVRKAKANTTSVKQQRQKQAFSNLKKSGSLDAATDYLLSKE